MITATLRSDGKAVLVDVALPTVSGARVTFVSVRRNDGMTVTTNATPTGRSGVDFEITAGATYVYTASFRVQPAGGIDPYSTSSSATITIPDAGGEGVTPPAFAVRLSWLQACVLGKAGMQVRRAGWVDRYVFWAHGLWMIQFMDATTKALGVLRVVTNADWTAAEFRALDWTADNISAENLAAAQAITTLYP